MKDFVPEWVHMFHEGYSLEAFFKDVTAGIIVGVVALPLAIAFGIASGVSPQQGLFTAIIAGFLISALSGSRVQIGGPTGAFVVIVFGIVQQYGYEGLALATMMAGVMLVIMGLSRMGAIIQFIPYPVTVGFTSGIALLIFVSQIRDFFGLNISELPAGVSEKIVVLIRHSGSISPAALGAGGLSLIILLGWPRVTRRVPAPAVAMVLVAVLVQVFGLPVETIGSRFGAVPSSLPVPHIPTLSLAAVRQLSGPAFTIAVLAAIESLLSAVVADGMTGRRHNSNMELVGQGVANIVTPLFFGIPATGAIARTATNIKNGGTSPVAGMVHAATLLLIMLFFGKWAALIPLPVLAAILMVVAWNMSEWRLFIRMFRSPKSDIAVLLITFLLTVLIDLSVAIQVGVVLAAILFMRRMALVSQSRYITSLLTGQRDEEDPLDIAHRDVPGGVEVFEIYGPFFFGVADRFKNALKSVQAIPRVLILRMRHVLSVDATALKALEDLWEKTRKEGTVLVLSGVHAQPLIVLERSGMLDRVGLDNVVGNIDEALARAEGILSDG